MVFFRLIVGVALCFLALSVTSARALQREDTAAVLERLGGYPCPDSEFTCITLTVPVNHFAADRPQTIDVEYAILPAAGERKGMFVVSTGGPGIAGIVVADSYTAPFYPALLEHFDIVFFNQRGVGVQCPQAAFRYYMADARIDTPEYRTQVIETARTFAEDCVQEMESPAILPFLSTKQAVEDLELFRQTVGDDQFWLYGESYGTQFAQTYAARYPEHLAALILDGTVDLTLSGMEYYRRQAQAFNDTLEATLDACTADDACRADIGGDALAFYDQFAAELAEAPKPFTFPLPSGGMSEREFTLSNLEFVAATSLYLEDTRQMFQRALAAASRDDLLPLARLFYQQLVVDPETLEPLTDPTYSDAMYYAVECLDYSFYDGTPQERAEAFLREGEDVESAVPHLSSVFYVDLPCVFWPNTEGQIERSAPLVAEGIPALVLGATADPATPVSNGEQVYSHLADGYLVTTQGGPHVTFGWGNECPDTLVTSFLVDDVRPERETTCEGVIAVPYLPLSPADAADFADPLEALESADTEINALPEYYYWDVETPTNVGCPYGGTLAFEPSDIGEAFTLNACAFSSGFAMTGAGIYDYEHDTVTLDVKITGLAEGALVYERDGDGGVSVTGDYAGQAFSAGHNQG